MNTRSCNRGSGRKLSTEANINLPVSHALLPSAPSKKLAASDINDENDINGTKRRKRNCSGKKKTSNSTDAALKKNALTMGTLCSFQLDSRCESLSFDVECCQPRRQVASATILTAIPDYLIIHVISKYL